jgi:hypothetical protein
MQAQVGDILRIHGRTVGDPDRIGTITEVLGNRGRPPYRVRFGPRDETVVMPGPETTIQPASEITTMSAGA